MKSLLYLKVNRLPKRMLKSKTFEKEEVDKQGKNSNNKSNLKQTFTCI